MRLTRRSGKKRLRKQPKMRRMDSAAYVARPKLRVSKTAKKRRRRNARRVHLPVAGIKQVVFSARWVSLILLAMVVFAIFLIGSDEQFYLTTIPVDGSHAIPATELVSASNLAGIHIFAADPAKAAAGIMGVPGVLSATVRLQWPNRVHVWVQENSPIAVWVENGNQFWVTRYGRLLPSRSEAVGLLIIESEMAAQPTGETTADEEATAAEANVAFVPREALAGALQLRTLRPNIDRLYYQPGGGLSYQDGRGWRAYFGVGTDMTQKLVVYETVVEELLAQGITPRYINVANQERPFYQGQ
ncbi:MAG: FtsQ-type POTRA domain-containing protein [Chloroflexi bacterium]|nr:FtsQ-type POTRA domain-containing protein [Chloroflexota bacterium]